MLPLCFGQISHGREELGRRPTADNYGIDWLIETGVSSETVRQSHRETTG